MNKLFTEQGFLSAFGENVFKEFLDKEINACLNTASSEEEVRVIGALLSKRVGDKVADKIYQFDLKKNELQVKHGDAIPGGGFIKFGETENKEENSTIRRNCVPFTSSIPFDEMSNTQFTDFLKLKYGEKWYFTSLTDQEFERIKNPSFNVKISELHEFLQAVRKIWSLK